ncbi:MAG: TetR/AcrR family transcriptional regulator [Anaerolineae bacterium]
MTRIVKAPDERRSELIAYAQKLFHSKGYESTSVRDIVDEIGVAKGTFYYYFDSKTAVLEAVVAELIAQAQAILQEIVADETLAAIPKWIQASQVIGNWKTERKDEMIALLRLLQKDENVLLQHKMWMQATQVLSPELAKIIAQGVEEGVFETEFIQDSAEIALAITQPLRDTIYDTLLNPDKYDDPAALARRKITAVQTAIERVLGAPPGSLPIIDEQTFAAWFED